MYLDHFLRSAIISALEFQRDNTLSQAEMDKASQTLIQFKDQMNLWPLEVTPKEAKKLHGANTWFIAIDEASNIDWDKLQIESGPIMPLPARKTASEVMAEQRAREVQARKWNDILEYFKTLDSSHWFETKRWRS